MIIPPPKLDKAYTKMARISDRIRKLERKHVHNFQESPEYLELCDKLDNALVSFRAMEQEFRKTYQEKYSKELAKLNLKYQVQFTYVEKKKAKSAKRKLVK